LSEDAHWTEQLFDGPYDREYASTVEDAELAQVQADFIVKELALTDSDRVLDLACGHGRHALLVAGHAAEVVGFDRTKHFIEYARNQAAERDVGNAAFVVGDMRELDYDSEFDAAYNYFTAWGYYDDDTNFDVLRRVLHALKPGGRFMLEFINRDSVVQRFQRRSWSRLKDGSLVIVEHWFDYEEGRMHSVRCYLGAGGSETVDICHVLPTADELLRMFRRARFAQVRVVAAPTGEKLTLDSRRAAVIGRKAGTEDCE